MSSPASIFCSILQTQFDSTINSIESIIEFPLRGIRDVKSNILRVEKLVYTVTKSEITKIENLIIQVLLLDQINQLETVEDFCRIAFSCQILIETLINNASIYLSFLDSTTISQLSANYDLFEKHVCVLGLKNLVNTFTNDILVSLRERLIQLMNEFTEALRLDELQYHYNKILIDSGIFELLNQLKKFQECAWGVCDWAQTSRNSLENYSDKLAISENNISASGWGENISSLLTNYYELEDELEEKIEILTNLIDNRNLERGIRRDEVMTN